MAGDLQENIPIHAEPPEKKKEKCQAIIIV